MPGEHTPSLAKIDQRGSKDSLQEVVKMVDNITSTAVKIKGPRMLPRVTLSNGKTYFIDARLNQLRNIKTPYDYIDNYMNVLDMDNQDRVKRCELLFTDFITVHCSKCNQVLFKGTEHQARNLIIFCADCS